MKTVKVVCSECGKEYDKSVSEYNRSVKLGRRFYCSLQCCGEENRNNLPPPTADSAKHLNPANRRDEFSPFRQHLKMATMHSKKTKRDCTINLKDLKDQWDAQQGNCPYTGWKMENPSTTAGWNKKTNSTRRASLDRIDITKGYVPGNVQFVCIMANYAKNKFKDSDLLEFCKAVSAKQKAP
jgi:hypothetical protein